MMKKTLIAVAALCWLGVALEAGAAAYQNLGSARVLLMNNDSRASSLGGITGQGYWDTNTTAGTTYWTHSPIGDNVSPATRTLQQGTEHVLHAPDGEDLWHLLDCRAGFVPENSINRNRLPYSRRYAMTSLAPSASFLYDGKVIMTVSNAPNACVVMRDNYKAAVYSPYYGEGIGTIYFDTVNSFPASEETIQLQIATNLTEDAILYNESNPDDAVAFEDVHKTIAFEKWDQYYDWQAIPVTYLDINKKSASLPITTDSTNLVLNVTDAGTNHFFRVRTQLNYYGPIRFRIKRITDTVAEQGVDTKNLVLIDNILASYPPMTIEFHRQGHPYDPNLRGTSVLGCIGDFDKPFLTYADKGVNAAISYSWVTNYQGTNIQITVNNLKFNYRWRYLDQKVNPWKTVTMTTNKFAEATAPSVNINYQWQPGQETIPAEQFTNLYTTAGIPLSGGVGDLEYFFTANVNAPYYKPRDYVYDTGIFGKMVGSTASWREQIGVVTNRLEVADDFRTPALGRDYFTRIREGVSDYKWVALCAAVTRNGVATRSDDIRMELVGDHTWRYHYYVPTNQAGETLSFHFKGEELFANLQSPGFQSRTNTWYGDIAELPYIPYASTVGLGGHHEVSCKLDDAATHLMIEFNDETLAFSIAHATYQNFNAWTDATGGYLGHANWNGEGAIGVADAKMKYTLEMRREDGWENPSFDNWYWHERFDTNDFFSYPWNERFDERRTPNGWTAGHGKFVRSQRDQDAMSLQLEGQGRGWIAMDGLPDDLAPQGIDQVEFKCRLAQEPRFEDFAWYMDGVGMTNYAVSARVSMGEGKGGNLYNPPDISPGTPSVSLVGYYRPQVGCYEFRITRSGQYQLCAALYKWTQSSSGMTSTLLASNAVSLVNDTRYARPGAAQPHIVNFGNYLVDRDGSTMRASCAYLYLKRTGASVALRGGLSREWGTAMINTDPQLTTLITYDDSDNALAKGTFGVGSTDCNARFFCLGRHELVPDSSEFNRFATYLNGTEPDWAYFRGRWQWNSLAFGGATSHLFAVIPTNQTVKLEFKPQDGDDCWKPSGLEWNVNSFATNWYVFTPRVPQTCKMRLRTGGEGDDDGRTDLVVDDIRVTSWRAPSYPDLMYYNGQSMNWVYMQGMVENYGGNTALRLQPSRGVPEKAMGLRSPFIHNGISSFSFDYVNADPNAKLLLQVCTNLVSCAGVSESLTTCPPDNYNWTTVTNWDFSKMSISGRARGTLTHYMSMRSPTQGLVRLIVDRNVVQHCIGEIGQPTRNLDYGQVTITGAYCYDEPAFDARSWYAWNFHTAGWNTADKRFAYLADSPDGLSGSLNFSALDADNQTADAEGIGLSDRYDIAAYRGNNSFVQCPPMSNGIGSVSFRARTFNTNATHQASWVALYGSFEPDDDQVVSPESWKRIIDFEVTNTTYQTFRWNTTDAGSQFRSIRLEVAGSRHGRNFGSACGDWEKPLATPLQRVFIDEVSVSEPVAPRIKFRNVRPFRSGVMDSPPNVVDKVADSSQQPLVGESWGLQCTVVPQHLGEEIVPDSIKVYAAFKRGIAPWGYENWSNLVGKVQLGRIGDTLTYRSSCSHPESIVPPMDASTSTYPDNVWQYYVWCEFQDKGGNQYRHGLDASDWTMPSWYYGITDFNEQFRSQGFAGYTILDTISPKRAWINEVNLCDLGLADNLDGRNQFIEIAVPRGADLTGWSLRLLSTGMNRGVIATYGFLDAQIVPNPKIGKMFGIDWTNDYTVVALRSPEAKQVGNLANSDGAWDTFDRATCNLFNMSDRGSLHYYEPYGIELVRPSGVVEHQIVVEGGRAYAGTAGVQSGSGTNLLAKAQALDGSQSQWFFAGADTGLGTLGVFKSHGEDAGCWTNILVATPSELNRFENGTRQFIDPGWFLQPMGTNVWIYASVFGDHVHQDVGGRTNSTEILIIRKGASTNIVYHTDPWFQIGAATTNGVAIAEATGRGSRNDTPPHQWTLKLPCVEDTIHVDVHEAPVPEVVDAGLSPTDPYYPAVMHWLATLGDDGDGLHQAEMWDLGNVGVGELDLKDMYWLGINPKEEGWVFKAGMGGVGPAAGVPVQPICLGGFGRAYTNVRVKVTMMITNQLTHAARAPDRLQGLEPGSSSVDYGFGSPSWTGVTFKVTGALQLPGDVETARTFRPLRWFVFTPDSFDENFQTTIDLWDPHSEYSMGVSYGWRDFPGVPVFYRWRLDDEPVGEGTVAEPLRATSTYSP